MKDSTIKYKKNRHEIQKKTSRPRRAMCRRSPRVVRMIIQTRFGDLTTVQSEFD